MLDKVCIQKQHYFKVFPYGHLVFQFWHSAYQLTCGNPLANCTQGMRLIIIIYFNEVLADGESFKRGKKDKDGLQSEVGIKKKADAF